MGKARLAALILLAAAFLASPVSAGPSQAKVKRAQAGGVRADLSYREAPFLTAKNLRLRIVRRGQMLYDERLRRSDVPTALRVRDVDGDGEPEVLADLYTGGAHCCFFSLVYRYHRVGATYRSLKHDWGNQGYRLADLDRDRALEFRSQDDRFAYAFSAYAASFFPIRVWKFRQGRMTDATRRFPALIARDARRLWREYLRVRRMRAADVRGVLAAYLADKYLLREQAHGWRRLHAAYRRGELRGFGRHDAWPRGKRYLVALRRFLARMGYAR